MKKKLKKLVIFGAGSSGKEIKLLVDEINDKSSTWEIIGFIDKNQKLIGKKIKGIKVYKEISEFKNQEINWVCSIMNPKIKIKICKSINKKYKAINLLHPSVRVPNDLKIGKGNVIFSNIHLSYGVRLGSHCMISFGCDIGHNSIISNYNSIMPGSIINGFTLIGEACVIGSGAIINTKIKIGKESIIGSGSFIFENVKNKTSVFNLPRQIKKSIK